MNLYRVFTMNYSHLSSNLNKCRLACHPFIQGLNNRHCHINGAAHISEPAAGEDKISQQRTRMKVQAMCLSDASFSSVTAKALLPHLSSGSTHECFPGL